MEKIFSYPLEDTMGGTAMRLRPIFTILWAFRVLFVPYIIVYLLFTCS